MILAWIGRERYSARSALRAKLHPRGDLLQAASKQRERSGRGQAAAWLCIAREVEVYLPAGSRASVAAGEPVWAGHTALARFQRDGD